MDRSFLLFSKKGLCDFLKAIYLSISHLFALNIQAALKQEESDSITNFPAKINITDLNSSAYAYIIFQDNTGRSCLVWIANIRGHETARNGEGTKNLRSGRKSINIFIQTRKWDGNSVKSFNYISWQSFGEYVDWTYPVSQLIDR